MSLFSKLSIGGALYKYSTPSYTLIQSMYDNNLKADHIALRSFKSTGGLKNIKSSLTKHGRYKSGGTLDIPQKCIKAEWFYTDVHDLKKVFPRIFVSELEEEKLPQEASQIIEKYTSRMDPHKEIICHDGHSIWGDIKYSEYKTLLNHSEYAAWTLVHGSKINHLAVSVPKDQTLYDFIENLKRKKFNVNNIGGEIKTSDDGLLHQGSTMSDYVFKSFYDDNEKLIIKKVPGFFAEFVQRDYRKDGTLREGFESDNALHIFDSTRDDEHLS